MLNKWFKNVKNSYFVRRLASNLILKELRNVRLVLKLKKVPKKQLFRKFHNEHIF